MEELDIALVFASRCVVRVSPGKQTSKIQDEFPKKKPRRTPAPGL